MAGKMFKTCAVGVTVMGLTALTGLDTQAAVTYRTVALTGDAAPGTDPGVVYSTIAFNRPVLNADGQTAFSGFLTGTGVDSTNNIGIWSEGSGSLDLVARRGPAPGTGVGVVYNRFIALVLNDAGQTLFKADLTGENVGFLNNSGIWSQGLGSLSLVARKGDAAPGTGPGVFYLALGTGIPPFNTAGQTAFWGSLKGTDINKGNDIVLWSGGVGSLAVLIRAGDAAPGTDPGVVFAGSERGPGRTPPALNTAGQTAFITELVGPGVDDTNRIGIWSEGSGSLELIARAGDAAPGTGPDGVFRFLGPLVLNEAGQIAFWGTLTNGTGGIWLGESGSVGPVVLRREEAPGTGPGVIFNGFAHPVLNGAGQVAFRGFLTGPGVDSTNGRGIWLATDSSLELIARDGDPAPGTDPGVVFQGFNVDRFVLNGNGQIAFQGFLIGTGVDSTNQAGIWVTDTNGVLNLLVREGDLFDVNDDPLIEDLRKIRFVRMSTPSGVDDGRPSSFNDAGQLAIVLNFTDDSKGIFVATIPEPGTLTLLGVSVGMLLRRRGRRGG